MTRSDSCAHPTGLLPILVLVVACGSEKQDTKKYAEPAPVRPQLSRFEASRASIIAGETVTLAWTARNVVSLALADDIGTQLPVDGLSPIEDSIEIAPTRTTVYTLTAFGPEGSQGPDERTVTVRVDQPKSAPAIESFSASPAEVLPGAEVTLSWRTTGATALALEDDAGEAIDHGGASLESGSVNVKPTRSRTVYTLVATGNDRQTEERASVDVLGLPRIHQFFVRPIDPVLAGTTVTLQWETSSADRVVITDDTGATIVDTTTSLSGSHSPTSVRTTEYTLTATGNGATTTAKVMARVGARIDQFTAFPIVARVGDPISLSWKTGGADSIIITAPGGFSYPVPTDDILEGSTVAPMVESGNYVLSARIGTVVRDWAIYVEATEAPQILSLAAGKNVITAAPDHPNYVSLAFVQAGAASCFLFRNDEAIPGYSPFACDREQTVEVQLTGAADLRLVVENHAGKDQATVHVDTVDPARIVSFTKDPERRLVPGGSVELAWHVTDAAVIRLERDGADIGIGASKFVGTRAETLQQTAVFRLIAENAIGDLATATRTVRAGAPEILSFGPGLDVVAPRDEVTFAWTCDGGDTLILTDARGEEKARADVATEIDAGDSTFAAPDIPGWYTYTLSVRNTAGQENTATFELHVTDGPLIRSFTASADNLSLGETLHLSWKVTDDWAGVSPSLTLEDNIGTPYDLADFDLREGTLSVVPARWGQHVFTLTAVTSEDATPSVAIVEVDVVDAPRIVFFAADPPVFHTGGSTEPLTTTLEWETESAVELAIYEAGADGTAVPPTLFRLSREGGATQAELDRGAAVIQPLASTRYLLWIRNGVGTTLDEVIWVLIDPPEILSFEADPPALLPGESTTLSWTTANATGMMLQPPIPIVTEIPGQWVDISEDPAAQHVPLASDHFSFNIAKFPPDFRFPYDGELRTGVLISMNGFLGFDLEAQPAKGSEDNENLPAATSGKEYVHLAPWWDYLIPGPDGKIYTLHDEDARTFTVMWKHWYFRSIDSSDTFDLNFEVILHENGDFEYRYGTMTGGERTQALNYASCSGCTIGFQDTTRSWGHVVRYNSRFEDASNLGWFFQVVPPVDGSREVTLTADRTYKLTAFDPHVAVSKPVTVSVWSTPAISQVTVLPVGPEIGTPYTVSWRASSATRIRLLDEQGKILCEETDPVRIAKGSCERTETIPGTRNYTLEAINGIDRNSVTRPVTLAVYDTFSLDSFSVSKTFIGSGESVEVRWAGRGGIDAELYECVPRSPQPDCTRLDIGSKEPNSGTYTSPPLAGSKEYRFRLVDRDFRWKTASAAVWVDIPKISSFTSSRSQIAPGEEVTLSWASNEAHVTFEGFPRGIAEVHSSPYKSISDSGIEASLTFGNANAGGYVIEFPDDFQFRFVGKVYSGISVRTDGWIGFDLADQTTKASDSKFPTTSHTIVHLGPFWADLYVDEEQGGAVYYKLETIDGIRALIVQWTHMNFQTSTNGPADLNFQAVLFETGNIEYRYGEMTTQSTSVPGAADGHRASIGLQDPTARIVGLSLTYRSVVQGGLSGRSWRITLEPTSVGSVVLKPVETTTYRFCANNDSLYEFCEEVRVVVVGPGDLLITELMALPTDVRGEWFEIRNLTLDPIDLAGFQILSEPEEEYSILEGVIQPSAYALFARSGDPAHNGGLTPDAVYGEAIQLASSDKLVLKYGAATIDSLTWTDLWPIHANRSMILEPSKLDRKDSANDARESWCVTSEVYGSGFTGHPGQLGRGCLNDNQHAYYLLDPASDMPFIDISETGMALNDLWELPYHSEPIPLGFLFNYFGVPVTEMTVLRDGALAMTPPTDAIAEDNSAIPNAATLPNGLIGPMWDKSLESTCQYQAIEVDGQLVMIVQWTDSSPNSANGQYGWTTFQAQLWENGDIIFAYGPVRPSWDPSYTAQRRTHGAHATIGLENIPADLAFTYYSSTTSTSNRPVYPGKTLHFHAK